MNATAIQSRTGSEQELIVMTLPPRSEWDRRTAAAFDAIAERMTDGKKEEDSLIPDDTIMYVRSLMGKRPATLDLGCGAGRAIPFLTAFGIDRIVGVDISEGQIRIAKTRYPDCDFRVGNIGNLKEVVGDEKFDAFWAIASLMHILPEKMNQAATSIREVLGTGAVGLITTPRGSGEKLLDAQNSDTDGGLIPEGHFMYRNLWQPALLAKHFELAGFEIIDPTFHDRYMITMTVRAD